MEETIWDPLRRKYVALTPEERVRQWFIRFLTDVVRVPVGLMMSEAPINLGAKRFRADIIVYDRSLAPLAVVECKKPEVELDSVVLDQAVRYNMVLNVKYIFITNGEKTCICRKLTEEERTGNNGKKKGSDEEDSNTVSQGDTVSPIYKFIDRIPTYEEMTV